MSDFVKTFNNPYPSGWENLPSQRTAIDANSLQQHTNAISNIEDYLSKNKIPQNISELNNDSNFANKNDIPKKVSELTNDSGYITDDDIPNIPSKTSELENDSGFITSDEIPKNVSELINDRNFVSKAVTDLLYYFTKDETYSKEQVNNLINSLLSGFSNWKFEIVEELPTENISETTVYCVPRNDTSIIPPSLAVNNMFDTPVENQIGDFELGTEVSSIEIVEE